MYKEFRMEKRHQDSLTSRLEDAYYNGCSHITWVELYNWYDVQKIAARTYRDLEVRWQSITDGSAGRLLKVEGRGGIYIIGDKTTSLVDENNILDKL